MNGRISIIGCSGSGKTTLARRAAEILGLPRLELDGVFHQPDWTPLPDEAFRAHVETFLTEHDAWIIDGNYDQVQDLVLKDATTVIWLHPPRWRAMWQVGLRTFWRGITRRELWNGNREAFSNFHSFKPERSMLAWTWTTHPKAVERYSGLFESKAYDHLDVHCFTRRSEADHWLAELSSGDHDE